MSQIITSTGFVGVVVGERSNQYYSYDGDRYISTFPQEWLLTHDTDETGPKHCRNCKHIGVWSEFFIGYCGTCAEHKYKGKRGLGFIDVGIEFSRNCIRARLNTTKYKEAVLRYGREKTCEYFQSRLDYLTENECFSASNTYLKGLSFKNGYLIQYIENETKNIIHQSNDCDDDDDDDDDDSSATDSDIPSLIHIDELRKRRNCIQDCETAIAQVYDKYYDTLNSMNIQTLADEYTSDTDSDMSIEGSNFLQHPLDDEMVDMEVENNDLQSFHSDQIKPIDPMEVSVSECNECDDEYYNTIKYYINQVLEDFKEDEPEPEPEPEEDDEGYDSF